MTLVRAESPPTRRLEREPFARDARARTSSLRWKSVALLVLAAACLSSLPLPASAGETPAAAPHVEPGSTDAGDALEIDGRFDHVMPEWDYEPGEDWGLARPVGGRGAKISWDFLNDTVSDAWYTASSPVRWRLREWLIVGGAAGATTALVFLADEPLRDAARRSDRFWEYGENVRWVGQGGALLGLTGGFLLTGLIFDRQKDLDTVSLMLESALIGHGYGLAMKYTAGRLRPRTGADARTFDPFSGNVSLPSGEALNVFILAGVVTAQYPSWPVRIVSYGVAGAVGAGRIALDAHWGSDILVSAVIGIAVSKAIVKMNRARARDRALRKRLELNGEATPSLRRPESRHYFGATARSVRWTWVF
jgi:hypothetical protein